MKMPTIEVALEISGIEVLHPGGYELSKRIGEIADIKGKKVLDVACGKGAFACYYARNFSTEVIGIDINPKMVKASIGRAKKDGVEHLTDFRVVDALSLPFPDNSFDVVINECAVGLTSDPVALPFSITYGILLLEYFRGLYQEMPPQPKIALEWRDF